MDPHMNLNGGCMIVSFELIKEVFLCMKMDLKDVFEVRAKRFIVLDQKISKL